MKKLVDEACQTVRFLLQVDCGTKFTLRYSWKQFITKLIIEFYLITMILTRELQVTKLKIKLACLEIFNQSFLCNCRTSVFLIKTS